MEHKLKDSFVVRKIGYILSRIFVAQKELEYEYPILKKYSFLLPLFEVVRWLKFIIKGDKKHSSQRYRIINDISKEKLQKTEFLFNKIGL